MIARRLPHAALAAVLAATLVACSSKEPGAAVSDTAADTAAPAAAAPSDSAAATGATAATDTGATAALLDPNTATREQLVAVPGMTPGAADALVAARPFGSMTAVDAALAKAQLDSTARRTVYGRVFRPLDLNTASGPEILLIPGVGPRMRHEFEEYRPYKTIERFRREIGKYVDQAEVARLERYVTIR
jgi:DNA uptake protein ComE-like DNA-binding protein